MIKDFNYIQKVSKALKLLVLSLIILSGLSSCNTFIEEEPQKKEEKGLVKINIDMKDNTASRSALANFSTSNLQDIKLTGIYNGNNYTLGSWWTLSLMESETFYLQAGDWQLKLTAKYNTPVYSNYNYIETIAVTFSDTQNITVSTEDTQSINFNLSSEENKGSLLFSLRFAKNDSFVNHAKYKITRYPSGELVTGAEGTLPVITTFYEKQVQVLKYGESALDNGNYLITVDLYGDSSEETLLNTYSSIIHIKKGFVTNYEPFIEINGLYNITWNKNGGTLPAGASLQEHYSMHSAANVTFLALTKDGYEWQGWYTGPGGSGSLVTNLSEVGNNDLVFYAHFTPIEYSITYELNGGTNDTSNPNSYTVEDADITLHAPSKSGFEFDGWYTDSEFTNRIESISTARKENLTLYAKWSVLTNINLLPVFPGAYSCNWSSATNDSNQTVITITIRDSGSNPVTPDNISVLICINGEPTGSQFGSASFTYPANLLTLPEPVNPGNNSFYVTVEINGQSYSFYAISG